MVMMSLAPEMAKDLFFPARCRISRVRCWVKRPKHALCVMPYVPAMIAACSRTDNPAHRWAHCEPILLDVPTGWLSVFRRMIDDADLDLLPLAECE